MPEKDLYNLSCSSAFPNTLIIPNVEGWADRKRLADDWLGRCLPWLGFVQAGRLPKVLWRSKKWKVSVSHPWDWVNEVQGRESSRGQWQKWESDTEDRDQLLQESEKLSWCQDMLCEGGGLWNLSWVMLSPGENQGPFSLDNGSGVPDQQLQYLRETS